jgi:hypothetical protein
VIKTVFSNDTLSGPPNSGDYSAEDFQRIYRLSHNCVEELCHILSACPEMQVRSPEFGGPERVSFEKTVLITLRYLGHAGNIRLISDLFCL